MGKTYTPEALVFRTFGLAMASIATFIAVVVIYVL